jgi:hypothetical protein
MAQFASMIAMGMGTKLLHGGRYRVLVLRQTPLSILNVPWLMTLL